MEESLSFIGAGRVGSSLARLLYTRGYAIGALVCRTAEHAKQAALFVGSGTGTTDVAAAAASSMVFLTVPDDQIAVVCTEMAQRGLWQPQHTVAHCSGALGTEALAAAAACGAAVLSLHPMQSIAAPALGVERLPGSYFGLEGCARGLAMGQTLVQALAGIPMVIGQGEKTAYHAGAVFASNYIIALLDVATELLMSAGIDRDAALQSLTVLAEGTLQNVQQKGLPQALTGPIERGDTGTIKKHLGVLCKHPVAHEIYRLLGQRTLALAEQKTASNPIHTLE